MRVQFTLLVALTALYSTGIEQRCFAQADDPKQELIERPVAGGRGGVGFVPFTGTETLNEAVLEAGNGDVANSLQLVERAFENGGVKQPFNHPDLNSTALKLLRLSRKWSEKNGSPKDVFAVLSEIVVPSNQPGGVFPYSGPWPWQMGQGFYYDGAMMSRPSSRLEAPDTVSAELVRWALLAEETDALRERLKAGLELQNRAWIARVVAVQLAVAEKDFETANQLLAELVEDAKIVQGPRPLELMSHAAMAAAKSEKTDLAGLRLLEAILDRFETLPAPGQGVKGNADWFRLQAARRHARAGRRDDALRLVKAAIDRVASPGRTNSDYTISLRRICVDHAAAAMLEGGMIAEALEILGPVVDDVGTRVPDYPNQINVVAILGRELHKLSAEKRYELLHQWVIPRGERRVLRDVTGFVPLDLPPGLAEDQIPHAGLLRDLYGLGWDLLTTAKQLGKLDAVMQELIVVPPQTPTLDALRVLGAVLRDGSADNKSVPAQRTAETTARLEKLLQTITNVQKWDEQNKAKFPTLTLLVATEAARHPEWRGVARNIIQRLIEHSKSIHSTRPRAHASMALMELLRLAGEGNSQETSFAAWDKMHPRHWVDAGVQSGLEHAGGSLPEVWYALDGMVQHITGDAVSGLSFEIPLTGTFEAHFDCREAGWMEGHAGYGGAQFRIAAFSNSGTLSARGGRAGNDFGPSLVNLIHKEPWNHYTIQVNGGSVRYRANGQVVHEDNSVESAPWLFVGTDWGNTSLFRNFKLIGNPTIPTEIPLLVSNRLRGWTSLHFGEFRSDALLDSNSDEVQASESDQANPNQTADSVEFWSDWRFRKGELHSSRRPNFWPGVVESWLCYQQPLRDGDSLRYEYFRSPGKTDASPTIGRIAFQFEPDGVTRHWLTDGSYEVFDVSAGNGILEKKKLDLKDDDWNQVEVSLKGDQLTISLNGKPAATQTLKKADSRAFGLYHDAAKTTLRVRDAVLTGDWPKELPRSLRNAFEWPQPEDPPADARFAVSVIGEDRFADNAYEIYRRSVNLDSKSRFEFLHRWVMPNKTHDLLRMEGAFTPTHPAPPVAGDHPIDVSTAASRLAVDQRRLQIGGSFVCPAIMLVRAAAETSQLEKLKQEVLALNPATSKEMARTRTAMLGIISLIGKQPEPAIISLWECHKLVTNEEGAMPARWGDVALASVAIQNPVTRDAAYNLLDRIQSQQLQAGKAGPPEFSRFVRQLHGQVHYLLYGGAADAFGTQPKAKQWRVVSHAKAQTRGAGWPIAAFDSVTGELSLRGGHDVDVAYFQSPLRGNYEVTARLSLSDFRELQLQAAGIANALKQSNNQTAVRYIQTVLPDVGTPELISPGFQAWCDYKVVVKDGRYTSFVNGQKLYEAEVSPQHDPWLAVLGVAGNSSRAARNVVITGKPQIPSELDLLGNIDLNGWLTDYYGNVPGQSMVDWKREEGVLMCDRIEADNLAPGRLKIENIIRYHRPMLEDGEISYEFYFDPEAKRIEIKPNQVIMMNGQRTFVSLRGGQRTQIIQTIVHPTLDRMVCLLEPDGVKIHWLTDGRFDRTGLLPENIDTDFQSASDRPSELVGSSTPKMPLKPQDWNAVKFAVKGDTLTVTLNGEQVFTHAIEPTNQRQFGLFNYANESNVRVRNVHYRGDWPKTLPPVKQQELAQGPEQFVSIPDADLPETKSWDFTGSKFKVEDFGYHWDSNAAAKQIRPTAKGLSFNLPAGEKKPTCAGLHPHVRLSGDFVATLDYTDMTTVPSKTSWGSGMSFKVLSNDQYDTGLETRQLWNGKSTRAAWQCFTPLRDYVFYAEGQTDFAESGRMRLVRRGVVLYYLTAAASLDEFRLLALRPIVANEPKQLNIQGDVSDESAGASFVIKSLNIRAVKLVK